MKKVHETALEFPGQNPNFMLAAQIEARREVLTLTECLDFVPNDEGIKQEIERIKSLQGYKPC